MYGTREVKLSQGTILGQERRYVRATSTSKRNQSHFLLTIFLTVSRSALNGESFWGFNSLPYAKPPVGDLRFRRPEPPEGWSGIKLAQDVPKCVQVMPLKH